MKDERSAHLAVCMAITATFPESAASQATQEIKYWLHTNLRTMRWICDFLYEDEVPITGLICFTPDVHYESNWLKRNPPYGLLLRTDYRLIFVCENGGQRPRLAPEPLILEYDFASINAVTITTSGIFFPATWVVVYVGTNLARGDVSQIRFKAANYRGTYKNTVVATFVEDVEFARRSSQFEDSQETNLADHAGDLLSTLERLTVLRQQGILTDPEFSAAKRRLLDL